MKGSLRRNRAGGTALITVLWVIMLGGVILVSVNRSAMVHAHLAKNELGRVQARWLARAGVEQALAILADDSTGEDGALDYWYEDSLSFEQVELVSGTFSVVAPDERIEGVGATRFGLTDLSGRLNLSSASEQAMKKLMPDITDEQVKAIMDWRDGDSNTRAGGAEQGYYSQLEYPYEAGNKAFGSIRELRLVRGIDDVTFFGEDTNLNSILDANENDGDVTAPADEADGELEKGLGGLGTVHSYENNNDPYGLPRTNLNTEGWQTFQDTYYFSQGLAYGVIQKRNDRDFENVLDLLDVRAMSKGAGPEEGEIGEVTLEWLAANYDSFTVSDDDRLPARINLNTAPVEVLQTLPRITEDQAQQIFDYRLSPQGPIVGYDQLLSSGIIDERIFEAIAEQVTLRSHVFEVRSVGVAGSGVEYQITAVIDRGQSPARVIYQHHQE